MTVLGFAAYHGNVALLETALAAPAGCDVNVARVDGHTPFSMACFYGRAGVAQFLLDNCAA